MLGKSVPYKIQKIRKKFEVMYPPYGGGDFIKIPRRNAIGWFSECPEAFAPSKQWIDHNSTPQRLIAGHWIVAGHPNLHLPRLIAKPTKKHKMGPVIGGVHKLQIVLREK